MKNRIEEYINVNKGGAWLAAARLWLQHHTINGDSVTWGSGDVIKPTMTTGMVEDLAAAVAEAAIREYVEKKEWEEKHRYDENSIDGWAQRLTKDK